MPKSIGILTAGGDSPGLNAAIRGVGKAAMGRYDMHVMGFQQGFRGLAEDRSVALTRPELSGILTIGGTILGTSRDKPHRMQIGNKTRDMTEVIVETYKRHHLDALVCLGGGGTQRNAYRLVEAGLNVITLPKTIDNDVSETDVTFGFDTALGIATEAIDRLHSTAHSHHRIIVVEVMGHNAGWLALGAGIAGGADVILLPEIPYDIEAVAESIRHRSRTGSRFSIVAISEGAMSADQWREKQAAEEGLALLKKQRKEASKAAVSAAEKGDAPDGGAAKIETGKAGAPKVGEPKGDETSDEDWKEAKARVSRIKSSLAGGTMHLSERLEALTGLESRVTILGHLQRGGTPSAADRLLATRLGTACASLIEQGVFGVMVASRGDGAEPVPLERVIGRKKLVPPDHVWVEAARDIGVCMGDA